MRIIGIDIGGSTVKLGVFNEFGEAEETATLKTDNVRGAQMIIKDIIDQVMLFGVIDAIGISMPGQIDTENGRVIQGPVNIPNFTGLELRKILTDQFNVPVEIINDVDAAALGEKHFGKRDHMNDYIFVAYGTGIGGSIVQNGRIHNGHNGFSGEFGHMITHVGGRGCNCGQSGCYERYASTNVLVTEAQRISKQYGNGEAVVEAYEQGSNMIQGLVDTWLDEVVAGLVSLIHIFNPGLIVLGGGIMEHKRIVSEVASRIQAQILPSFRDVSIIRSTLGNKAGMLGAVSLHV